MAAIILDTRNGEARAYYVGCLKGEPKFSTDAREATIFAKTEEADTEVGHLNLLLAASHRAVRKAETLWPKL